MKRMILSYLMQKLAMRQAQGGRAGSQFRVRRVGPLGGILLLALLSVVAVVGVIGFAVLSAFVAVYAIGRSLFSGPKIAPRKPEATITVVDANGKTVAEVPRSA